MKTVVVIAIRWRWCDINDEDAAGSDDDAEQ